MEESHPDNGTEVVHETIVTTKLEGRDLDPPPASTDTTNDASINEHPIPHQDDDDDDDDDDEFGDFNHTNVDQGNQIKEKNVDDDQVPPVNDVDGTVHDDTTTIALKDETVNIVINHNNNNNNDDHTDTNHARQCEPVVRDTPHESFVTPTPPSDGGGDNGAETMSAVTNETNVSSSIVMNHKNDDDDDEEEEDFDAAAAAVPPMAQEGTASSTDALVMHHDDLDEMDAFGNFDSVTPTETTITKEETNNNDDDDNNEDFGDFDAAPPVSTTSDQPIPHDDEDDDDDFGDFDEAPAPTEPMALDDGNANPPSGVDPMVTKCRHAMSVIFRRYVSEERKTPEKDDDHRDVQIPHFDESEIVTIESVLASLETFDTTPMIQKVSSHTIMHPISRLFVTTTNDADAAVTPSRCIMSKHRQHSPTTLYRWIDQSFISDRSIQSKTLVDGELDNNHTNGYHMTNNRQGPNIHSTTTTTMDHDNSTQKKAGVGEPSETAKAFLERIPDLSFMLSNKLSITN